MSAEEKNRARAEILAAWDAYASRAAEASRPASQILFCGRYNDGTLTGVDDARTVYSELSRATLSRWLAMRRDGWDGLARYKGRPGYFAARPDVAQIIEDIRRADPLMSATKVLEILASRVSPPLPTAAQIATSYPRPRPLDPAL